MRNREAMVPRRLVAGLALALTGGACVPGRATPGPKPGSEMAAVTATGRAPFSSICRLEVRRRLVNGLVITEKAAISTGALVDDGHLLTAAHTFASPPHTPVTRRAMECGRQGRLSLWARTDPFYADQLHVVPAYEGEMEDDYAVLRVGREVPLHPGFRLPRAGERVLVPGDTVHVAGYALDSHDFNGKQLYHGAGMIRGISRDSTWFIYDVDTRGGMSGSPVWVTRTGADGRPEYVIVGVHVGRHSIDGHLFAVARRIGGDALVNVRGWLDAN